MSSSQQKDEWHAIAQEELLSRFETDASAGLSITQAEQRKEQCGENRISGGEEFHLLAVVYHQLINPLVIVLIAAGIISLVLGERADAFVVFLTVAVNTVVGAIQEGKASRAFIRLQELTGKRSVVVRAGAEHEIAAEDVVPGDIIIVRAGNAVSADARLLETRKLHVNESVLTGEWIPIEKNSTTLPEHTRLVDRTNMIWAGTLVEEGWARALVVNTAYYTEFGKISVLVGSTTKVRTPLQRSMASLARSIGMGVLIIVTGVFLFGILRGESFIEMLVTSVAIAVAAVPEGLPVAVTVILALGMERILRNGGLVKKLTATETLGSTTIILTDKTGTLTEGNMQVSHVISCEQVFNSHADPVTQEAHASAVLIIGISTSDAFIENPDADLDEWVIRGTPTDRALMLAAMQAGIERDAVFTDSPRIDFLPFESERRFAASLHTMKGSTLLRISGAPEVLLERSSRYYAGGRIGVLGSGRKEVLRKKYEELAQGGNRVLATAFRKEHAENLNAHHADASYNDLVLVGFIAFHDPLRADVAVSIQTARKAGIRPIMVTGDNRLTALAIAREVGILQGGGDAHVLEGQDIEEMSAETLEERIADSSVYARVLPHQKLRIVEAWQKKGAVVAMTGDGVNDAPALKRADVGVALGSGTDVAKESADLVLLENSFSTLVSAIEQGRVIRDNLRKVIAFVFATGFTEIVLVGGSLLLGFPLPVLATQILWTNLIGGGLLNFAFAFEPKEEDIMMQKPSVDTHQAIFTRQMWLLVLVIGLTTDVLLLGLFLYLQQSGYGIEHIRTLMFLGLALDSIFFAYSLRSLRRPLWRIRPFNNPFFIFSLLTSIFLLFSAFFFESIGNLLSVTSLGMQDIVIILTLGVFDIIAIEAGKWFFIRRKEA